MLVLPALVAKPARKLLLQSAMPRPSLQWAWLRLRALQLALRSLPRLASSPRSSELYRTGCCFSTTLGKAPRSPRPLFISIPAIT